MPRVWKEIWQEEQPQGKAVQCLSDSQIPFFILYQGCVEQALFTCSAERNAGLVFTLETFGDVLNLLLNQTSLKNLLEKIRMLSPSSVNQFQGLS